MADFLCKASILARQLTTFHADESSRSQTLACACTEAIKGSTLRHIEPPVRADGKVASKVGSDQVCIRRTQECRPDSTGSNPPRRRVAANDGDGKARGTGGSCRLIGLDW